MTSVRPSLAVSASRAVRRREARQGRLSPVGGGVSAASAWAVFQMCSLA